MDEEQTVFEQITLINFKKWSFTSLKARSQSETIFGIESSLKMMKNAFYFTLKVSPVLKIFLFSIFGFLVMSKNGLIRKIRLISEFMTLQLVNKQLQYTY